MKKLKILLSLSINTLIGQTYPNSSFIALNSSNIGENYSTGVEARTGYKTDTYFLENATKGWYNGCLTTYTLTFNQKYYYTEICAKQTQYDFQTIFNTTLAAYSLGGTYMPTIIECDQNFNNLGTVPNSTTNPIFNGKIFKPGLLPNAGNQGKRYYKIFVTPDKYKLNEECSMYTVFAPCPAWQNCIGFTTVYNPSNGKSYFLDESQSPFKTSNNPLMGQYTNFYQIRLVVDFNWGKIASPYVNMCNNLGQVTLATMFGSTGYGGTYTNLSNIQYPDPINTNSYVPGNYIVNYVSTSGGCSTNNNFNILPKPTVTIAPYTQSYCLDSNTVNVAMFPLQGGLPTGGLYYLQGGIWPNGMPAGNSFTMLWGSPGLKKVKYVYTAANGCIDSAKTNITILQGTTIYSNTWKRELIQGTGTKFDTIAGTADQYNWQFGDGLYATNRRPYHYYNSTGYFDVTLALNNSNGCTANMVFDSLVHVVPFVGLEELNQSDLLQIDPTLVAKTIYVKNQHDINIVVDLINAIGENVGTWEAKSKENLEINMEHLAPGMYYAVVQAEQINLRKIKKIVKQ